MFAEYDCFILCNSIPGSSIPVGTQGVVLMVFDGEPVGYEVEFTDGFGGNLEDTTFTITEEYMKK